MPGEKGIVKLAGRRTALIDRIIEALEKRVSSNQSALMRLMVTELVDDLDRDGDNVKNTVRNKRIVGLVDTLYSRFMKSDGLETVKGVADGVKKIIDFNASYFGTFVEPAKLAPVQSQVKDALGSWLGMTERGALQKNGYLDTLVKDATVKNKIRDMLMGGVVSQKGYQELKKGLGEFITGGQNQTGALQRYYRNLVYDTFSVADRTAAKITADKLKFNYAIYEGGLIKTSREFCKERNGKVFSRDEIAEFDPDEAKQPGYNPFTDLGGYGCRHHLNWIPDALAFALRPELKTMPPKDQATIAAKAVEPKQIKGGADVERPAAKTPFDKIEDFKIQDWAPGKSEAKAVLKYKALENIKKKVDAQIKEANADYQKKARAMNLETDSAKKLELQREIGHIVAQFPPLKAKNEAVIKKMDALNAQVRNTITEGLARSEFKIENKSPTLAKDAQFIQKLGPAVDFIRAAARGYFGENLTIQINAVRAGARAYNSEGNIHVSKTDTIKTIVHELAHTMERHNVVLKAAVDFHTKRTKGNPVKQLRRLNPAYRRDEVYQEGDFYSPYVGKIYKDGRVGKYKEWYATEIISMGLDRMFIDPLGFYRADREHFNLIYSLFFKR